MDLRAEWDELWKGKAPKGLFERVVGHYNEPHRHYHTLDHIKALLEENKDAPLALTGDVVEFSIWFHDVIYDVQPGSENEKRSAEMARSVLLHKGSTLAQAVYDVVMATDHKAVPVGIDEQVMVDLDLSILGKPEPIFDQYEVNIRKEYAWVPQEIFDRRRAGILQSFLDRPKIYSTTFFQDKYEQAARENLQRSIDRLQA